MYVVVWFDYCVLDYYVWQWEDEKGKWNPYNAQVTCDLENARIDGTKTVNITASHRSYDVSIPKMEQVNTVTNVSRTVDRMESGKSTIS